ncbi:hypothetical protein OC845_006860 [Tilletia horrida]|nr:hypothetical protein OC845_006860 [Tilletia horrida]
MPLTLRATMTSLIPTINNNTNSTSGRHHQAHQPAPQEINNPYFTDLSLRDRHHAVPYCGGILHLSPPNAVLPACQMFFGLLMQQQLEQEEEEVRRGQAAPPLQQHHQQQQQQDGREGEEGDEDDDGSDSSHSHSSSTATASAHELALDDLPLAGRNNGQYVGAITANAIHEALITGNITLFSSSLKRSKQLLRRCLWRRQQRTPPPPPRPPRKTLRRLPHPFLHHPHPHPHPLREPQE